MGCARWTSLLIFTLPFLTGCPTSGDEYEPDDDLESAASIDADTIQDRTFHSQDDIDFVILNTIVGNRYILETALSNDNMDTILSLLTEDGTEIAYNDDYIGLESRLEFTANNQGPFYALVDHYEGSYNLGDYTLSLTHVPYEDNYEPDETIADAAEGTTLSPMTRSLESAGDIDHTVITLAEGETLIAAATIPPGSLTQTRMDILTLGGEVLVEGTEVSSDYGASRGEWLNPEAGPQQVIVRIRPALDDGTGLGPYTLTLETIAITVEANVDIYEPDNSQQSPSAVKVGIPQDRTIHSPLDKDVIRFEAQAGIQYEALTTPTEDGVDLLLSLFDDNGAVLDEDDDSGDNGELIKFGFEERTFVYLEVRPFNQASYGAYTLLMRRSPE